MLAFLLALIAFGPPGPWQHASFHDAAVTVDVKYRISHDRENDVGPAAASPSISAGSLDIGIRGRRMHYDLAEVLGFRDLPITLPDPHASCNAGPVLSHRAHYLILQWVYAAKGCSPYATLIDLDDGAIATMLQLDRAEPNGHAFDHLTFVGSRAKITRSETVAISKKNEYTPTADDVKYVVVRWVDSPGRRHLGAFPTENESYVSGGCGQLIVPHVGQAVQIGTLRDNGTDAYPHFAFIRVPVHSCAAR